MIKMRMAVAGMVTLIGFNVLATDVAIDADAVWVKGAEREMNAFYGFVAKFNAKNAAVLRYSAASIARVWVNGKFVGYGPARSADGYMRVDELKLDAALNDGVNVLAIEVSSPMINQFYLPERSPFLVAEILVDGKQVVRTGRDFKAQKLTERVQKVNRFSYQRGFAEFLKVRQNTDVWRVNGIDGAGLELVKVPKAKAIGRDAPYPDYAMDNTFTPTIRTKMRHVPAKKASNRHFIANCGQGTLKGFRENQLEVNLFERTADFDCESCRPAGQLPIVVKDLEGVVFKNAFDNAGFPRIRLTCRQPATVWLIMEERANANGLPDPCRSDNLANVCGWELQESGEYELECFEPNEVGVAHIVVEGGEIVVRDFNLRTYLNPNPKRARFESSNLTLNAVFAAAKNSLAANAVDCFTDCPGRERAIYFGDTTFTARGADVLLGDNQMESVQFMNYAMADSFRDVPKGMIPMCYPSDVTLTEPHWIPNFGMWSVVQLAGQVERSGDAKVAEAFRPKAEAILAWFRNARNADGLLEKIPGWVFVEWSDAAKFVQDISYATNMLYVKFLDSMAKIYGMKDCADEAERVKATIRAQSWTGEWFSDNSIRQPDGSLKISGECTEVCQCYAFFSGVATKERYPDLWNRFVKGLGPMRSDASYPKIYRANILFGYMLRFLLLDEAGLSDLVLREVESCFGPMAARTGTLWEGVDTETVYSCCHGFPSMAAWLIVRNALGVRKVDRKNRTIGFSVPEGIDLDWCDGVIPVSATEDAVISWRRGQKPKVVLPVGWRLAE